MVKIDINKEYKIIKGENNKKYYFLSNKFWEEIQTLSQHKNTKEVAEYINKLSFNKITKRSIENWITNKRKPQIVDNFDPSYFSEKGCKHGFDYFCLICNKNKDKINKCPVPLLWVTHPKGKCYVYDKYWKEIYYQTQKTYKLGFLSSSLYPTLKIDQRTIRRWKENKNLPKIYGKDCFSFSKHNIYFLGLFLSDGHIRKNGSKFSYTYQSGSSDIFQGYWYPQLIQRFLPIFKNKSKISNTYFTKDKKYGSNILKTNLSSLSPIFVKKIEKSKLIVEKDGRNTSSYYKKISSNFLEEIKEYQEYFQGVFDGDGSYNHSPSPIIDLSLTPDIEYSDFIKYMNLIPTLTTHNKHKFIPYKNRKNNKLYMVRFAPGSLKNIPSGFKPTNIVKQLGFFLDSAQNSIRPDKVHKLIKIIKKIISKKYGLSTAAHPFQKRIKKLAIKNDFLEKVELLQKRYPIKNNKYLPFMPKWLDEICSKKEAWEFFFNKENLSLKEKGPFERIEFSEGIPVNLK